MKTLGRAQRMAQQGKKRHVYDIMIDGRFHSQIFHYCYGSADMQVVRLQARVEKPTLKGKNFELIETDQVL